MEKKKKIFHTSIIIVEILLLIGAYFINYFTRTRMGMMRYVVHKNYVWEETYKIEMIKQSMLVAFIVLVLIVFALCFKRRTKLNKLVAFMNIVMGLLMVYSMGFVLMYSPQDTRAYYFISMVLALTLFIHIINTFVANTWLINKK